MKQAVAEYSGDLHSRIAQTQVAAQSGLDGVAGNPIDEGTPAAANSILGQMEGQAWSSSMLPSYLPRSTLIPGTTYLSPTMELNLSLGLPQISQPALNFLGQQNLADDGDLFLALSLNPDMSSVDNVLYHDWQAAGVSVPRPT